MQLSKMLQGSLALVLLATSTLAAPVTTALPVHTEPTDLSDANSPNTTTINRILYETSHVAACEGMAMVVEAYSAGRWCASTSCAQDMNNTIVEIANAAVASVDVPLEGCNPNNTCLLRLKCEVAAKSAMYVFPSASTPMYVLINYQVEHALG